MWLVYLLLLLFFFIKLSPLYVMFLKVPVKV